MIKLLLLDGRHFQLLLKVLDLGGRQFINSTTVGSKAWQTLFNQLSQTSIENLNLESNQINDSSLATLANIGTLKSLGLKGVGSVNPAGWSSFFYSLQRRGIQLKKLDISLNCIGDVGIQALGSLLSNLSTLRTLVMFTMLNTERSGCSITEQGWIAFFNLLEDSNLGLTKLFLDSNNIENWELPLLVRTLSNMSSLKCLSLGSNSSVTFSGWQALTGYFQSPNFALEELCLGDNNINDDTVIAFTSALEHNKTLKRLSLEGCTMDDDDSDEEDNNNNELITERGWEAMSTLLCNKRTIMDTYNSNHTLQELGYDHEEMNLPNDLISYLELNKNKDKVEVARQKILQTHFSDTSKMQVFLDIELEIMPAAFSWIGRPTHDGWRGTKVSGLSLLYNLTRRLPDLFDSSTQKKKSSTGKRKYVA